MTITGPVPVSIPPHQSENNSLALRIQERISAEVLQVAGDKVLLSVDGVRLVARLTDPDQSAQLMERRQAQFVVKDLNSEVAILQLVSPGGEKSAAASAMPVDLIPQLLERAGIPVDEGSSQIAQALLQQRLPVTSELVNELRAVLSTFGEINVESAQIAAAMKANGLPLSPDALALALSRTPLLTESLKNLVGSLLDSARKNSGLNAETLQRALKVIQVFFIDVSASPETMASQLETLFAIAGRSIESRLNELLQNGVDSLHQFLQKDELLTLLLVQQEIHNQPDLLPLKDDILKFLDSLRLVHYTNTEPEATYQQAGWLCMELPFVTDELRLPLMEKGNQTAQLKVAYRRDETGLRKIDPRNTRLVISMDIESNDILEVDISIVDQNIKAHVSASNQSLQDIAKDEISNLEKGLSNRGYSVVAANCNVDADLEIKQILAPVEPSPSVIEKPSFTNVNLEA